MENPIVLKLFAKMTAAYGNIWSSQFTDERMSELIKKTWGDELSVFSDDIIAAAFDRCVKKNTMPPTLPALVILCDEVKKERKARMNFYVALPRAKKDRSIGDVALKTMKKSLGMDK